MSNRQITLSVDEDDYRDILNAIGQHQASSHAAFNEHQLPEGTSDTAGATLGEICRDWMEYKERVRNHVRIGDRVESTTGPQDGTVLPVTTDRQARCGQYLIDQGRAKMLTCPCCGKRWSECKNREGGK